MRGSATLTTVESSMAIVEPSTVVSRIQRPRADASGTAGTGGSGGAVMTSGWPARPGRATGRAGWPEGPPSGRDGREEAIPGGPDAAY